MNAEDTLAQSTAQWTEQFNAVRQRMLEGGGKPGLASQGSVAGRTGLQFMQGMLAGHLPYPHIAETLDFGLVDRSRAAVMTFSPAAVNIIHVTRRSPGQATRST